MCCKQGFFFLNLCTGTFFLPFGFIEQKCLSSVLLCFFFFFFFLIYPVCFLFCSLENSAHKAEAASNKFVFGQNMIERVLVSIISDTNVDSTSLQCTSYNATGFHFSHLFSAGQWGSPTWKIFRSCCLPYITC